VANNLANANTTGFRAQIDTFRAVPVQGSGLATRTQVLDETAGTDFSEGPIRQTGRSLDVAISGPGWIAVQGTDGKEAYTRAGGLMVDQNGLLQTKEGLPILGDNGTITVPFYSTYLIGKDGTVSTLLPGAIPEVVSTLGRIKLVNPPPKSLTRSPDGLFRTAAGGSLEVDPTVSVVGGALEDSNVNTVEAMVNMINLSRSFDLNMSLLKNAETNADKANQILTVGP
jgi:flagellar basal-body rod protein FlgF